MSEIIYIKAYTNWLSEHDAHAYFLPFSEDGKGKWGALQLTEDASRADYFFIVNYPPEGAQFDPARTIVFQMEPRVGVARWGEWAAPKRADFLQVRSHDVHLNNLEWWLKRTWSELSTDNMFYIREDDTVEPAMRSIMYPYVTEQMPLRPLSSQIVLRRKPHCISAVVSDKYFDPGHIKRVDFLRHCQASECAPNVDIYGTCESLGFPRWKGALQDKSAALYPYKYHFAAENHREHNYITEKLVDAILADCLCFYWGAPNAAEIFGEAFIPLSLDDFQADCATICAAVARDEWALRLPAIRAARKRILYQYSIFPTLQSTLTHARRCRRTYCLNLERRADRRAAMVPKLAAAGIDHYEFRRAVDGRTHSFTADTLDLFAGNDFGTKRGVMACALGHYGMWRELVADEGTRDDDYYFILEDDVEFEPEFARWFACPTPAGVGQWDMFFPSYLEESKQPVQHRPALVQRKLVWDTVVVPLNVDRYIGGFHCYLISKTGARKLCDFIARNGIQHGIDYLPKRYGAELGLRLFEARPQIARAEWVQQWGTGDTDIQIQGDEIDVREIYRAEWNKVVEFIKSL